jgi:hypothetical protein
VHPDEGETLSVTYPGRKTKTLVTVASNRDEHMINHTPIGTSR